MPTAEDVVVSKLRWARPKEIEDVGNVLLVQSREAGLDLGLHAGMVCEAWHAGTVGGDRGGAAAVEVEPDTLRLGSAGKLKAAWKF